jgi:hypothetical protein
MRELFKAEIYGALGMDFLKQHAIRIDFDRAEVTFLQSVGSDPGVRIPVTFEHNVPQVEVKIPGLKKREKFLVDTGHVGSDGCLRAELFDALAKRGLLTPAGGRTFETASGFGSVRDGRVEVISLGRIRHKNLLFVRAKLSTLSLYYWAEYKVVTFDFANEAIYLKNRCQPDHPDEEKEEKNETLKKR